MRQTMAEVALELKKDLSVGEFYTMCRTFLQTDYEPNRLAGYTDLYFYDRSCLRFERHLDGSESVGVYAPVMFGD